jgi:hypothetical protein
MRSVAAIKCRQRFDPSDIEIWFGDEFRIGQMNEITRRWARRGSRPSALRLTHSVLARPGWLAPVGQARGAGQHHHRPAAAPKAPNSLLR